MMAYFLTQMLGLKNMDKHLTISMNYFRVKKKKLLLLKLLIPFFFSTHEWVSNNEENQSQLKVIFKLTSFWFLLDYYYKPMFETHLEFHIYKGVVLTPMGLCTTLRNHPHIYWNRNTKFIFMTTAADYNRLSLSLSKLYFWFFFNNFIFNFSSIYEKVKYVFYLPACHKRLIV